MSMTLDEAQIPFLGYFLAGLFVALGLGAYLLARSRSRLPMERLALLLCPPVVYVTLTLASLKVIQTPDNGWEATRLAPALALLSGAKLYVGPHGTGALMNTTFPPIAYLIYVPAGLFARATSAIIAGSCISLALYLAPTVALSFWPRKVGDGAWPLLTKIVGVLILFQAALTSKALNHAAFSIHADAPMLAFTGFAALALTLSRRGNPLSLRTCLVSTACASLAVWSELSAAPMILILPIWVFATRGFRDALRYSLYLVLALASSTLLVRTMFGISSFTFNILELPRELPWYFPGPQFVDGLLVLSTEFFLFTISIIASILLAVLARWSLTPAESVPEKRGLRRRLDENRWLLFVAMAFAAIPISFWARLQIGGFWNNYAPTVYFLTIGLISLLLEWHAANHRRGLESFNAVLTLSMLLLVVSPLAYGEDHFRSLVTAHNPSRNEQEVAYRFSKRHPGEAYFPWNPLSNLMGEGRVYDFDCALFVREVTGHPITPLHVRANLAETVRYVCFPPGFKFGGAAFDHTRKYLPEFTRPVEFPELAGWACFERTQIAKGDKNP